MTNRKTSLLAFAVAALVSLLLPVMASAQAGPWWGRDRDTRDRNTRDRDYRRDRDGDYRSGRNGDYNRRGLRDVARRIKDRSKSFQRNIDRFLDDSRYDDTRREDRINQDVRNFRDAADRFEDRVDDNGDINRGASEARQLLSLASQIDRYASRVRLDSRSASDWAQIRNDLRIVANVYGVRMGDYNNGGYGRGDDDYRRGRNRRNNGGGVRWPF